MFLIILFLLTIVFVAARSQTPEAINYQTIIRDNTGAVIVDQKVCLQLSILQGSATGSSVYTETQTDTTNDFGLINLQLGTGTTTDDFSSIDWFGGPYFLSVEVDVTGNCSSYILAGTSQLISVPYAIYAKYAENVDDADADSTNELQTLELTGTSLSISDGNNVILPISFTDTSAINELQYLSYSNDTLYLSQGNFVVLDSTETFWEKENEEAISYNGGIKIGQSSTCDSISKGIIRFNYETSHIEYCDGTYWIQLADKGDRDGDGADDDLEDNCPGTYNPNQADSDDDGIGDACDVNPTDDPLFSTQLYLKDTVNGIWAYSAWDIRGGDGSYGDITLAVIGQGWDMNHTDLPIDSSSLVYRTMSTDTADIDLGTSILGVICAKDNDEGCMGIVEEKTSQL